MTIRLRDVPARSFGWLVRYLYTDRLPGRLMAGELAGWDVVDVDVDVDGAIEARADVDADGTRSGGYGHSSVGGGGGDSEGGGGGGGGDSGGDDDNEETGALLELLACANMLGVAAVQSECEGRLCDLLSAPCAVAAVPTDSGSSGGGRGSSSSDNDGDSDDIGRVDIDTILATLAIAETYCCEHLQRRCLALLRYTQQQLLRRQQLHPHEPPCADVLVLEKINQTLLSHTYR